MCRCAVATCPTGRRTNGEKKYLFRVPSNPSLRKQWELVIPGYGDSNVPLKKSQYVCELHFEEHEIARKFIKRDTNGKIIAEVTLVLPHLEKDVIPSLFDDSAYKGQPNKKVMEKALPKPRHTKRDKIPEPKCSILGCRNNWRTSRRRCENISYHKFPESDVVIRQIWIQRCRQRPKGWNPNTAHICSVHFPDEEFITTLETKYPEVDLDADPELRKLKPSALPSLYLGDAPPLPTPSKIKPVELRLVEEVEDCTPWPEDETVVDPLQVEEVPILSDSASSIDNNTPTPPMDACTQTDFFPDHVKIEKIENPTVIDVFTQIKTDIEQEKKDMTQRATQTIVNGLDYCQRDVEKDLKLALDHCEGYIKRLKTKLKSVEESLDQANSLIHRKNETNLKLVTELGKKPSDLDRVMSSKVVHDNNDMFKALTIRYMNRQCYSYLKDTLNYPFPSVSQIREWANKINLREGILGDVLKFMKIAGSTMSDVEKVVILQMDQTKVQSVYEYDDCEDEIIGQLNYMQVITARSLFSNWKQPVYIEFDTLITGAKICKVIRELHEISINVVACVCNPAMEMFIWKELGVSPETSHFRNPSTGAPVYVFSDTPYLLKLLCSRFLQYGFVSDEKKITAQLLKCLLDQTIVGKDSEFKFTEAHITVSNDVQMQSVTLATQLMSSETASALRNLCADNKDESVDNLSTFMERIDIWYQLANSRSSSCTPYGSDVEYQSYILLIVEKMIRTLRCHRKQNMKDFQAGIALSISSLRSLFVDMKTKHNINFIRTYRLNMQDPLEDLFTKNRGNRQCREIPTPVNAIHKIRSLVLGINSSPVEENRNMASEPDDYYVVRKVLETAEIPLTSDPVLPSSSNQDSLMHIPSPDIDCTTEDGTSKYLAGWLANRYGDVFPDVFYLGQKHNEENVREPSKIWFGKAHIMDSIFRDYHKNGILKTGKGVTKNIIELAVKKFGQFVPRDIIHAFVMRRTFLKINLENAKARSQSQGVKRKISDEIE